MPPPHPAAATFPEPQHDRHRAGARVVAAIGLLALLPLAAQPQVFRDTFRSVTATNFDAGGPPSRQFHLHTAAYRPHTTIHRTDMTRTLPGDLSSAIGRVRVRHADGETAFADYVAGDPLLDAVLVLHKGRIVFEAYPNMQPWQRHFAWSVTKVVTATTLATLAAEGRVDMQLPVGRYLPDLADSAWGAIPLQHLADMASGIDCLDSDGYQDQASCVYRMEESLGVTAPTGHNPAFIDTLKSMQRRRSSGEVNEYVSANTNVLGLVIEQVLATDLASAVQERIWSRIGAEADALMTVNDDGFAYASGGLSARLRDIGRFGEVFMPYDDSAVLPETLRTAMAVGGIALGDGRLEEHFGSDTPVRAAWQWDLVWEDGAMFKGGYSGQGLYVDPGRTLVVAWFGTGRDFSATINAMLPVSRQLARALDTGDF